MPKRLPNVDKATSKINKSTGVSLLTNKTCLIYKSFALLSLLKLKSTQRVQISIRKLLFLSDNTQLKNFDCEAFICNKIKLSFLFEKCKQLLCY